MESGPQSAACLCFQMFLFMHFRSCAYCKNNFFTEICKSEYPLSAENFWDHGNVMFFFVCNNKCIAYFHVVVFLYVLFLFFGGQRQRSLFNVYLRRDWNIASMMHNLAASPMVQLCIICQGHSTIELRGSRRY